MPAPMSSEFYEGVDQFLKSAPPPSLSFKSGGKKKQEMQAATKIMKNVGSNAPNNLRNKIDAASAKARKESSDEAIDKKNASLGAKPKSKKSKSSGIVNPYGMNADVKAGISAGATGRRDIDISLLNEAFSYTEKLLKSNMMEEAEEAAEGASESISKRRSGDHGNGASGGMERPQYVDMGGSGPTRQTSKNNSKQHPRSAPLSRSDDLAGNANVQNAGSALRSNAIGGGKLVDSAASKRVGSNLVKKIRMQAAAYGSSGQVAKGNDLLERRAMGSFDTSLGSSGNHGYRVGSSEEPFIGNSSSGLSGADGLSSTVGTAAKNRVDYSALIANFETGDTLKQLREELARSQASQQRSTEFARHAMMSVNFNA